MRVRQQAELKRPRSTTALAEAERPAKIPRISSPITATYMEYSTEGSLNPFPTTNLSPWFSTEEAVPYTVEEDKPNEILVKSSDKKLNELFFEIVRQIESFNLKEEDLLNFIEHFEENLRNINENILKHKNNVNFSNEKKSLYSSLENIIKLIREKYLLSYYLYNFIFIAIDKNCILFIKAIFEKINSNEKYDLICHEVNSTCLLTKILNNNNPIWIKNDTYTHLLKLFPSDLILSRTLRLLPEFDILARIILFASDKFIDILIEYFKLNWSIYFAACDIIIEFDKYLTNSFQEALKLYQKIYMTSYNEPHHKELLTLPIQKKFIHILEKMTQYKYLDETAINRMNAVYIAAQLNFADLTLALLEKGVSALGQTHLQRDFSKNHYPMTIATINGNLELINHLLNSYEELIISYSQEKLNELVTINSNSCYHSLYYALLLAGMHNNPKILNCFLSELNFKSCSFLLNAFRFVPESDEPLMNQALYFVLCGAIAAGNINLANQLINDKKVPVFLPIGAHKGTNETVHYREKFYPLVAAAKSGNLDLLKQVYTKFSHSALKYNEPEQKAEKGYVFLLAFIYSASSQDTLNYFISLINDKNEFEKIPFEFENSPVLISYYFYLALCFAAEFNKIDSVKLLLGENAIAKYPLLEEEEQQYIWYDLKDRYNFTRDQVKPGSKVKLQVLRYILKLSHHIEIAAYKGNVEILEMLSKEKEFFNFTQNSITKLIINTIKSYKVTEEENDNTFKTFEQIFDILIPKLESLFVKDKKIKLSEFKDLLGAIGSSKSVRLCDYFYRKISSLNIPNDFIFPQKSTQDDFKKMTLSILLCEAAQAGNRPTIDYILTSLEPLRHAKAIYLQANGSQDFSNEISNLSAEEKSEGSEQKIETVSPLTEEFRMNNFSARAPLIYACRNADVDLVHKLLMHGFGIFYNITPIESDTNNAIYTLINEMDKAYRAKNEITLKKLDTIFKAFCAYTRNLKSINYLQFENDRENAFQDAYSLFWYITLVSAIRIESEMLSVFLDTFSKSKPKQAFLILHLVLYDAIFYNLNIEYIEKIMILGANKNTLQASKNIESPYSYDYTIKIPINDHVAHAIIKNRVDILRLMKEKNYFDMQLLQNSSVFSPLGLACVNGNLEVLQFLIKEAQLKIEYAQADETFLDKTEFMHAAEHGEMQCLQYLVEYMKQKYPLNLMNMINAKYYPHDSYSGYVALSFASQKGRVEAVKYLLSFKSNGLDINVTTPYTYFIGNPEDTDYDCHFTEGSPLFQATKEGHYSIAMLLLDNGASATGYSNSGCKTLLSMIAYRTLVDTFYSFKDAYTNLDPSILTQPLRELRSESCSNLTQRLKELKFDPNYCPEPLLPAEEYDNISQVVLSTPLLETMQNPDIELRVKLVHVRAHLIAGADPFAPGKDTTGMVVYKPVNDENPGPPEVLRPTLDYIKSPECPIEIKEMIKEIYLTQPKTAFLLGIYSKPEENCVGRAFAPDISPLSETRLLTLIFEYLGNI